MVEPDYNTLIQDISGGRRRKTSHLIGLLQSRSTNTSQFGVEMISLHLLLHPADLTDPSRCTSFLPVLFLNRQWCHLSGHCPCLGYTELLAPWRAAFRHLRWGRHWQASFTQVSTPPRYLRPSSVSIRALLHQTVNPPLLRSAVTLMFY